MTLSQLLPYSSAGFGVVLAIVFLLRAPRTISDWMFAGGMLVLCFEALLNGAAASGAPFTEPSLELRSARLVALSFLPGFWLVFSVTYARGSAADTVRKRGVLFAAVFLLPPAVAFLFRQHLVAAESTPADSFRLGWAGSAIFLGLLFTSVAVLMNLEQTFRAAVGTMRWRIKFMLLGVGVLFVTRLYSTSQALLFGQVDRSLESLNSAALLIGGILIVRSLFRTGRFALDVYPSESVLQSSLTVLLAGIYLLIVGVLAKAVAYFGGDTSFAIKAFVVLVALVLGALVLQSDRARLLLRKFISRNFQRPLYDYRAVWRQFTEATASRVEQVDLCRALVRQIAEMFQALSVSIWVMDGKKHSFALAASTSVSESTFHADALQKDDSAAVLAHFAGQADPVDIEQLESPGATVLRRWHPSVFPNGGHRICMPLTARGELLGLIIIGDRVAGAPFSVQDFDMLKCVGDHSSANLYNVHLSQKLLQARELEAFQTMATFFVHDLKNAASTLKLMLQNLPVHFDDPEFRADALRGTAKTVSHIDHLIGRLSSLRHELKMQLSSIDLNAVAEGVIATIAQGSGVHITQKFADLPAVDIDRDQISKVITNLILNAVEASPKGSPVHVTTSRNNTWVVLSVSDSGCGMSPDFLNGSLFKPFQTTKKSGLGIGMFQSKLIVEAHGGRIAVASELNRGTTFEIFLPVPKN